MKIKENEFKTRLELVLRGLVKGNIEFVVSACSNDFSFIKIIAIGGEAIVILVRNNELSRKEILKIALPKLGKKAKERFFRSVTVLSKLGSYGCFPSIYCGNKRLGFIVMEHIEGETLREVIENNEITEDREKILLWCKIAEKIAILHQEKTIHRDIKPDNIIFKMDGEVAIIDFGMAKDDKTDNNLTMAGEPLGTKFYISPEAFCNANETTHKSDIYSLAKLFYFIINGNDDEFEVELIGYDFLQVISKALSTNPVDRHENCLEMISEIKKAAKIEEKEVSINNKNEEDPELDAITDLFLLFNGNAFKVSKALNYTNRELMDKLKKAKLKTINKHLLGKTQRIKKQN